MCELNRVTLRKVLLLALLSAAVSAQNKVPAHDQKHRVSPSIFEIEHSCKATHGDLRIQDLTVLDFRVGSSTMRDVQKRFAGTGPVKLTHEEGAEEGICVKNREGTAVVFATSVMGSPDTLTGIYLAPSSLVEGPRLRCEVVELPSEIFASQSGIHVGASVASVSRALRAKVPADGPFCAKYEISSSQGPLQLSKGIKDEAQFTDFTGAEGYVKKGKVEWVVLFGVASD